MVVLNRIYTRTGDGGDTALSDGSRVAKHDPRVEAYGTVDELNSVLGIARLHAEGDLIQRLSTIQNDLFDLGADLARPNMAADGEAGYEVLRIVQSQVERLEAEIDAMNADLNPLRSFILPGGSTISAHLHHARTVARRAERRATELAASTGDANPAAVRYLNRLSDWLFVAARSVNDGGRADILWVPGASR
ncbi:cob(I)yrinic acid a,c-diamide adenosyltransferase [Paracoccus sp. TK19116]|uniref:Corrinoid adenosyltransferase n=1 Tax=Paracoccus albicereus TaxID=2922394 RepID=A0ABT1MV29_9RHOB|nr:cob(I)yrinic acid a,c-diamide adenosyltransferase [Paracoccus albicereus]MCQ0972188.1 cob(I)yrinic acid a,c-diamide adenosyltransferase [Paracoccus albicereus]